MTLALGCFADDYNGASDLANTLTRCGLRTVQTIGVPDDALALPDVDAVVVSLKIRSIEASQAVARAREADRWLRGRGAAHVLFKICSTFDSTDAGNIGPVTDALRADSGDPIVLVTPAFPGTGRTVYQGHLFVGSVPLNESPLKDHPLNPMHDANLVRVLARQSRSKVGLVDLATVTEGAEAIRARLVGLVAAVAGAAIVDAVSDSELEVIGQVALDARLSVGASGMGLGLARSLVASGRAGKASTIATRPRSWPAACLAEAARRRRWRRSRNRAVDAGAAARSRGHRRGRLGGRARVDWARGHLARGPVLIASSATPDQVAALQSRHGRDAVGHAIEQTIAAVGAALVEAGVRRLVVAGGETSGAVVDRLGIPAFLVGPEIAPGVPVLRAVGTRDAMVMALKSGNFGGPDFFNEAIRLMP